MRKGLVVTLGVALVLSVAPAFAEAPIISCLPDIIISNIDEGGQTFDVNLFVFTNALDLDDYVVDYDTPDASLRWSFMETTGNTIRINGVDEIAPGAEQLEPGAKDIRAAGSGDGVIDFQNVAMHPSSGTAVATLEFWVSDGTASRSESVVVTTISTDGTTGSQGDALVPPVVRRWRFDASAEGWTWFDVNSSLGYAVPAHQFNAGSLEMSKTAAQTKPTYGSYESPKDPNAGVQPKVGCIYRGAFKLRGSGNSAPNKFPGFRLQALTSHMVNAGGQWSPNFASQDYLDYQKVVYDTLDPFHVAGREPGATAKDYQILSYPFQAAETLLSTDTVMYFSCDLYDSAFTENDLGTLFVDEVVVDGVGRPAIGAGTLIDAMTSATFASGSWVSGMSDISAAAGVPNNVAGLVTAVQSGALVITVAPGNQAFEAFLQYGNPQPLVSGNWYRLNWTITATVAPGENFGPRVRVGLQSQRFVWIAHKDLDGGGLIASFDSTPKDFEMWCVAPSPQTGNLTEGMRPIFESWLAASNTGWPFYKTIAGTARVVSLTTEAFDPVPIP